MLLWQRLIDDWTSSGLPLLTEDQYRLPAGREDRPLHLLVWYWARFSGSRNCLVVADQSQSGRLGLLLRALRRRPHVRILLVVNHLNEGFRYRNALYTRLARRNETATLHLAHRIVVHTRTVADSVRARGVGEDRITVIPAGVDKVDPAVTIRRLGPEEPLRLLWVGGDFVRKGLSTLLRALEACPHPRPTVTVVGRPHTPALQEEAEAEVAAGNLGDVVRFLGQVSDERLASLWKEHDVYVQPSLHEGHGSALDEAMIRGMPCVASDLPVFRERLAEADVCFFPPEDAGALADCLVRLRPESPRKELAAAARGRAAGFPSWSDTLTAYRALVETEFDKVRRG